MPGRAIVHPASRERGGMEGELRLRVSTQHQAATGNGSVAYPAIHCNRGPCAERTGFPFDFEHWCRRQTRCERRAHDPTAPSALADPGLVLVRGSHRASLWDETKGWIMTVKLNDAQLVMMSAAAQREDRCLAAPERLKGAAVSKVSAKLVKLGLAREIRAKP